MATLHNLTKSDVTSGWFHSEQNMDQKALCLMKRWIDVNNEARISVKGNEEKKLLYEKKAALEETIKNLHEQVACLLCECNAKDELMAEHLKTAQEAITGKEKAETEVAIWKQELEDTLQQNIAAYERLVHLNASFKNCRQQLSSLKLKQDQRINLERAHKRLESKYTEARKKLANLTLENALLTKALVKKEEIIKNVSYQMSEKTSEYFPKMRIRNADVANWKHQDSVNLEAERQRLRLLVKKRIGLPRQHLKPVDERMSLMINRLSKVEEENRILKESVCERENEIRVLKEVEWNREARILELERKIVGLESEVERVNKLKRTIKDQFENLKLINVALEHQLSDAKFEIKEAFQKVFVLEMELEDRSHQYEGLEAACLELQLQLASVSSKEKVREDHGQEGKLLSSLREHMAAKDPPVPHYNTWNSLLGVKSVVPQALPIVPRKKHVKGTELLRKLLFRRKRGGNKKKLHVFAAYHV
ncbi:hypothetical protein L2E82_02090 [Cichorium intybus]|uniref:Uncharacterized protein n=1 Tax=Cichorium intybus TaxID=13427 RepID=A0ACB9H2U0_CICIN|nr:hypothetical protein L2E82_02090 [Cichorium intybus]